MVHNESLYICVYVVNMFLFDNDEGRIYTYSVKSYRYVDDVMGCLLDAHICCVFTNVLGTTCKYAIRT